MTTPMLPEIMSEHLPGNFDGSLPTGLAPGATRLARAVEDYIERVIGPTLSAPTGCPQLDDLAESDLAAEVEGVVLEDVAEPANTCPRADVERYAPPDTWGSDDLDTPNGAWFLTEDECVVTDKLAERITFGEDLSTVSQSNCIEPAFYLVLHYEKILGDPDFEGILR